MERVLKKVLKGFTFDFRIPAYTLITNLCLKRIIDPVKHSVDIIFLKDKAGFIPFQHNTLMQRIIIYF